MRKNQFPPIEVRMAQGSERDANGCLTWRRNRDKDGYGKIYWNGRYRRVHTVAYELLNGPIPAGMMVCHKCDNPPCCDPNHLFLGTARLNTRDMIAKGRFQYETSMTQRQASIVKQLLLDGFRICDAAFIAGCKSSVAKLIKRNRAWQYVKPALEIQ